MRSRNRYCNRCHALPALGNGPAADRWMETMFKKSVFTLSAAPMLANTSQLASASGNAEQAPEGAKSIFVPRLISQSS